MRSSKPEASLADEGVAPKPDMKPAAKDTEAVNHKAKKQKVG